MSEYTTAQLIENWGKKRRDRGEASSAEDAARWAAAWLAAKIAADDFTRREAVYVIAMWRHRFPPGHRHEQDVTEADNIYGAWWELTRYAAIRDESPETVTRRILNQGRAICGE